MAANIKRKGATQLLQQTTDPATLRVLKRPTISYKKLVIPSRLKSIYWKYFGFPADDDAAIITRKTVVCILCKNQMVHHGNTSNLRTHLQTHHKALMSKIQAENPDITIPKPKPKNSVTKINNLLGGSLENIEFSRFEVTPDGLRKRRRHIAKDSPTVVISEEASDVDFPDINIIFPNSEDLMEYTVETNTKEQGEGESMEINEAVMNFIITDLVSPAVVGGRGFHSLISGSRLPNEKTLMKEIIPTTYQTSKAHLYNTIIANSVTNISLSIEEWKCADGVKCLSIYAHYLQNNEPVLVTNLLTTLILKGNETVEDWDSTLDKTLSEWNINCDAITIVLVAFSIDELKTALCLKKITLLPCFLHLINDICAVRCFQSTEVMSLLQNCREVAGIAYESQLGEEVNPIEEDESHDDEDSWFPDRPHLWVTTYYMLKGLLRRRQAIIDHFASSTNESTLSASDWDCVEDLVNLFEPLESTIGNLFLETNYAVSLLNPLIWKVSNLSFKICDGDSFLTRKLKLTIRNGLNEAYAEPNISGFIRTATVMDPRCKSFLSQQGDFVSEADIIDLLTDFVTAEGLVTTDAAGSESPVAKKPGRLSGISALFGDFHAAKQPSNPEDRIKYEVSCYEAQSGVPLDLSPLEWWHNMQNKFPNLMRLARKYLCVPSMITLPGYNGVADYIKYYDRRAALKCNVVNQLLFLHLNRL